MPGKKEDARELNAYIDMIRNKVYEAHRELVTASVPVTAEAIKQKLSGSEESPQRFIELFEQHNQRFAELVGKEYAKATLVKYNTCLSSLKQFLKWKYGAEDIPVKDIQYDFITDFEFYLKSVQNIAHNTAMGYIKKVKKVIRSCVANNLLDKDPFMAYRVQIKKTGRTYLLEEELKAIENKQFQIDRLNEVRDLFLFSCYTGLSYSDVEKLIPSSVVKGIDGEQWIYTSRTKTGTSSHIPLLPQALAIINKYREHPKVVTSGKLLPVISNQRLNSYLKEVADCCGIRKNLTFHIARHTFATTVTLSNGVPIETVSKMLGHTNIKTTQHYAKILDMKVSEDMQLLKQKFAR